VALRPCNKKLLELRLPTRTVYHKNSFLATKIKISRRQALALENVASYTGLNIGFAEDLIDAYGNTMDAKYDVESRSMIININGDDPIITSVVDKLATVSGNVQKLSVVHFQDHTSTSPGHILCMLCCFGNLCLHHCQLTALVKR